MYSNKASCEEAQGRTCYQTCEKTFERVGETVCLEKTWLVMGASLAMGCSDDRGGVYCRPYGVYVPSYRKKIKGHLSVPELTEKIERDPRNAELYYKRALGYSTRGQPILSIKDFSKAIELNPTFLLAYYFRANRYFKQGYYEKAINDYSKLIELNPSDDEWHKTKSFPYKKRGHIYIYSLKNNMKGCADLMKACSLGDCSEHEGAKEYCRDTIYAFDKDVRSVNILKAGRKE